MAFNFSANQFEQQFLPKSLCNWQVPKWNPRGGASYPRQKTNNKVTRIIANDRGHLLPGIGKSNNCHNIQSGGGAFTSFRGTSYNLPAKILTKQEAFELNGLALQTPFVGPRWIKRGESQQQQQQKSLARKKSQSAKELRLLTKASSADADLSYTPGQIVEPSIKTPHPLEVEHRRLVEELSVNDVDLGNKLYLEEHDCEAKSAASKLIPIEARSGRAPNDNCEDKDEMMKYHIPDKPTENENFIPFIPAYCNFETARMMSKDNLRHQPLPDAVVDTAFRTMQASGDPYPGLALDIMPVTTGVGVRSYQAGPTQCTKMRIYRPKTCGVMPKPVDRSGNFDRPHSSICEKKMGPMEMAICWDFRPADPRDEPKRPAHIDGSNGSAAPAVFSVVKTPRESDDAVATGRSTGAVFSNTLGQENFFNNDLVTRNREYNAQYSLDRKCECENKNLTTGPAERDSRAVRYSAGQRTSHRSSSSSGQQRPKTTADQNGFGQLREQKSIYKSSPNLLAELVQVDDAGEVDADPCQLVCISHQGMSREQQLQRVRSQPDLNYPQRIRRMCHNKSLSGGGGQKILSNPTPKMPPFKAGIPNRNNLNSFDSGFGSSGGECARHQPQIRIPKPRDPYAAKNYNINTLAPPFACWQGGAGQGGYPEHWRLASVYQHAYKPIDQRRRPLLATVYQ